MGERQIAHKRKKERMHESRKEREKNTMLLHLIDLHTYQSLQTVVKK